MPTKHRGEDQSSPFFFTPLSRLDSRQGFTLVELSIVLVILGILVSLGAGALGPLTKRAKFTETKETVKTMKEVITSYVMNHGEAPCGATDTCAGTDGDIRFNQLVTATDSLKAPLFYIYSDNLRQEGGNLSLCSVTTTHLTLRICHDAGCASSDSISNVAFIVGSKGLNLNKQINGNGSITTATTVTVYDPGIPNVPDGDTSDLNRGEEFDDVYAYVTLLELKGKAQCTATSASSCTAYEIYNGPNGPQTADFLNTVTAVCYEGIARDAFVTSIGVGGTVERHQTAKSCSKPVQSITFSALSAIDSNKNCQVNVTQSGLADR